MNKELTFADKQQDINKDLNSLIMSGMTGGFYFDEECSEQMIGIVNKINNLLDEQQGHIEVLYDSLEHAQYQNMKKDEEIKLLENLTELQDNAIKHNDKLHKQIIEENEKLKLKLDKIQAMYDDYNLSDDDFINEVGDILESI